MQNTMHEQRRAKYERNLLAFFGTSLFALRTLCCLPTLASCLFAGFSSAFAQDSIKPLSGPVFLATGEKGTRVFSQDGKTWTHLQTDRDGVLLKYAGFLNGRCVAAGQYGGDRLAFVTTDGVKWDSLKLPGQPYATRLDALFVSANRFHAILFEDNSKFQAITSEDGKNWLPGKSILDDWKVLRHDAHLRRFAQGNECLVLVGDYGARLSRKIDAEKFEAVPKALAKDTLIDIAFGNGVFVGGGLHGLRMRSKDGLEWTDRTVGEEGEHINSMIFDGKQFLAIGQGATYRSEDGQKWERIPNRNAPTACAFGNGVYVGSLWPGKLLRSTDAVRWEQVHELPHHVLALTYGNLGKK
jgi:hypothetical protein